MNPRGAVPSAIALSVLLAAQSGCGRVYVNRTLHDMTQESAWQADPATPAKQPLRYAIGQCFSENIGDRQLTGFNSPLLFDAYEGCMKRNGYTRVAPAPSR